MKNQWNADGEQQNIPQKGQPMLLRCISLVTIFVLAAGALGLRLSQLQLTEGAEWRARAAGQQLENVPIPAIRGVIYDANMKPMALSATVWTVVASPDVLNLSKIENSENDAAHLAARELAAVLELSEDELYEKLADKESKYCMVKMKIEKPLADKVREICETYNIGGIYLQQDTKRYYPYEEMAATVLGFTNTDGTGIEGLEQWYNEVLSGTPGRTVEVRNAWGGAMPTEEAKPFPAEDGNSIVLTLDTEIQRIVEKHLLAAVQKYHPQQRAMAVVMDVNTGAILSLAVCPSYNPNDPYYIYDDATREAIDAMPDGDEKTAAQATARTLQWRNKALADTYEPGSVMKVITASAAIDSGVYGLESPFTCGGEIEVADRTMACAQGKHHGTISLQQALIESCNVSFVQIGLGLGATTWYDYINAFGLTEPTGVDLPGEPGQAAINNLIYGESQLGPVQLASCSFGQSNKYTALQMVTAVSAAVNGGNLVQPHIVKQELDAQGNVVKNYEPAVKRQVISPETSSVIASTLESLVANTTNGQNAYVAGYRVGGKSGTSQKLELLAEDENNEQYISSFLGFAPADNPEIAVLVVLDEPEDTAMGNFFGGRLAGPSVREIIKDSMGVLGIAPAYGTNEELARTTVTCPNVVENDTPYAQKVLNQQGLDYRTVGTGATVVGQWPAAHSQIPYGGTVILYTDPSVPQETANVPDLSGKTASEAISILKGLGLNVLTTGAPDSGNGVVVIGQDVAAGAEVPKGTVVTLTMEDMSNVADH